MTEDALPAEAGLPAEILAKADFRYNEYAWRIKDIPEVIRAATRAGFMSLGGQLQIRIPDAIGECHWVETDPAGLAPADLPWAVRIRMVEELALQDWEELKAHYDFAEQVRLAFPAVLEPYLAKGGKLEDALWFTWYVIDEENERQHREAEGLEE
ncbi:MULTISPECIES: hypothetical protein [Asticcacaulis]|jgi:hypothetical protein|uniref:Uncharacterized protein n=1 Tax=Asticcacaulis currens TaxID=2984210 RepID=A0ABT5I9V9_9CAUL|nr:hypothetical protein [Asticcacaulis currens]MDC7692971.1 hypothetical protein [Asticcacaulis currens]